MSKRCQMLKTVGTGILIGLSINATMVFIQAMYHANLSSEKIVKSYFAAWVIGIVSSILSTGFERESVSLAKATLLHYIGTFLVVVSMGVWAKWVDGFSQIFSFLVIFTLIYIGIYLGFYISQKKQLEEINRKLKTK